MSDDEELLPLKPESYPEVLPDVAYPSLDTLKLPNASEEQVSALDAELDHYGFKMLAWAWRQVRTINDVAKLLHMQHEHQIHHRNHRLMPNAHRTSKERVFTIAPLD